MAVVAGSLFLGISRSLRSTQLATSKQRLERMMLQAFRFSAVSGHVGDVVLEQKEGGVWEGYLNLWEFDARGLRLLAQNCVPIGSLRGIESIALNDREVHAVRFRFFGGHGLSAVYAHDQFGREMPATELRFAQAPAQVEQELDMTLRSSPNSSSCEKISLKPYLLSTPHHRPFPDEYLQASGTTEK